MLDKIKRHYAFYIRKLRESFGRGLTMNIYLCKRTDDSFGWDYEDYVSFVCVAESIKEAVNTLPTIYCEFDEKHSLWTKSPDYVKAILLGKAKEGMRKGVVCVSCTSEKTVF